MSTNLPMTDQPTESELKPCPFCGSHPIVTPLGGYDIHQTRIECCGFVRQDFDGAVRATWNTRPAETELQSLMSEVERLQNRIDAAHIAAGYSPKQDCDLAEVVSYIIASRDALKSQNAELVKALEEIKDAEAKWLTGVGSYAGGETSAGRMQQIATRALAKTGGAK